MEPIIGQPQAAREDVIFDADISNFMALVVEGSMSVPILVDFWAEWCGPCKQLTPILEKVVMDAGGKVRLVKVDADKNQEITAQLRIQSLPTVMAFVGGKPVDGFAGAVPESEVKALVERLQKASLGGNNTDDRTQQIEQYLAVADEALNNGNVAEAENIYTQIAAADPESALAVAGMARVKMALGELDAARAILDAADDKLKNHSAIKQVYAAIDLAGTTSEGGDIVTLKSKTEANPKDAEAHYNLGNAFLATGDMAAAADSLLNAIAIDREWNEGAAHKKLLKLLEAAGADSELSLKARRRLSSLLFC